MILPANKFFCFIDTKIIYQKIVVVLAHELYLKNFRYKQYLLVVKHIIDIRQIFL